MALIIMVILNFIQITISATFKYLVHGPPKPSWSLKHYLILNVSKSFSDVSCTIEEIQENPLMKFKTPIPSNFKKVDIIIPNEYRINAQVHIEKLIKPYEIAIDPAWKSPPNNDGITCELIMNKSWEFHNVKDDWEKEKIFIYLHGGAFLTGSIKVCRGISCKLSKASGARALTVEYRLAPQQPFPAALCDLLATYLYLLNPPKDSGFKPYKPEQIVICGESSGGGLSVSLGLVLRDSGLPLPAGLVAWSPWLDMTHSMPSFFDKAMNKTDTLPAKPGFLFSKNLDSDLYNEFESRVRSITKNIQDHPEIKLIGDDSLKRISKPINVYVVNEGFGIPYASPMLAESLGGLPPTLMVAGNGERLRDETIYFSYRAANPEKYRLPIYENDFDNSHFKFPTKIKLELYDDMMHSFQLFALEQSKISIKRTGEFISNVVQEAIQSNPPSYNFEPLRVNIRGEVQDLDESSIENVLNWDKAGVFPGV